MNKNNDNNDNRKKNNKINKLKIKKNEDGKWERGSIDQGAETEENEKMLRREATCCKIFQTYLSLNI